MTFASCFLYAKKLFFSKSARNEKTAGRRSMSASVVCIAVSLVPLVALLCVSNGMISGITGRMIHLSTQDIMISATSEADWVLKKESFFENAEKFRSIEGVVGIHPEIQGMALAAGSEYRSGATFRAVEKDIFKKDRYYSEFFKVIEGNPDLSKKRSAVIGQKLSEILNLHCGDKIKLITVKSGDAGFVPKVSVFNVTAIVSSGYQELDALWVFVPLEDGFDSFAETSKKFMVGLETENPFDSTLDDVMYRARMLLLSDSAFRGTFIEDWRQANSSQFENFASTKALLIVILVAIILVASLNICSAIVMIVMERKKEISILKSTGGSSMGITLAFTITGFFCGLTGLAFGVPVGILVSANINRLIWVVESALNFMGSFFSSEKIRLLDPAFYLQDIPVVIPWGEIAAISIVTLVLSLLMSFIPSVKAGKSSIVDSLNKN